MVKARRMPEASGCEQATAALVALAGAGAQEVVGWGVQAMSATLGLSCGIPIMSTAFGFCGCTLAGAAAGRASASLAGVGKRREAESAWIGAAVGVASFALLGGRYAALLPSDVAKPGAFAARSIPASGREYASASEKEALVKIYKRSGCHTCGSKSLKRSVIGDHMPPNKEVHGGAKVDEMLRRLGGDSGGLVGAFKRSVARSVASGGPFKSFRAFLPPPKQRFYPQCEPCSLLQSEAVRTGKRRLVTHFLRPCWRGPLAGALAGLAAAYSPSSS